MSTHIAVSDVNVSNNLVSHTQTHYARWALLPKTTIGSFVMIAESQRRTRLDSAFAALSACCGLFLVRDNGHTMTHLKAK